MDPNPSFIFSFLFSQIYKLSIYPNPRKLSLSPTQFLQSRTPGSLSRSREMRQAAMDSPLVFASPVQVLEAKGNGASDVAPVVAVACVIAPGANSVQRDDQGHLQESSSVSFPSPTFNMPTTEHAQALHRNLAAELIRAGSGSSPLLPSRNKFPQEPGTAISMSAPTPTRRNNRNSSLQVHDDNRTVEELLLQAPQDNRTVDELRDERHQFGEAGIATRSE
jgi:hypothetical protein